MNKQYRLRIDVINLIIRFMFFLSITSFTLFSAMNEASYIWKSMLLLPAAIISFVIRKYSKNLWSFIVLNLLLLAPYILLTGDSVLSVAYGINIVIFAIIEYVMDINKKIKASPLVFSISFISVYILCKLFFTNEGVLSFFLGLAIAFGLLYIVNMYYVNSYIYFKKHEDKANLPIRKILSTNTLYIGGFLLLSSIVMFLFTRIPLGGIGQFLRSIMVKLINFLVSMFLTLKKPDEMILEEEAPNSTTPFANPEPSLFTEIVSVILGVITLLIIIAFIIYGIYRIYKLFYSRALIIDDVRTGRNIAFTKDSNKPDKNPSVRHRFRSVFDNSNNVKIRRLFIRAVQKNARSGHVLKYKLPKELSEYALEAGKSNIDELAIQHKRAELTAIYENARYSNTECSKEDVKLVKDILKQGRVNI